MLSIFQLDILIFVLFDKTLSMLKAKIKGFKIELLGI
jgi:hypothetical protein